MELYPHQKRILNAKPNKEILVWEMRTGKSLPAQLWLQGKNGYRLVVTPKQNKESWKFDPSVDVFSKEEFKKHIQTIIKKKPTAIVIDEAHYFASPLFIRRGNGRSQLAEALYTLVKTLPDMKILLLTATPLRQDAWSLHTLLCYKGVYYDWKLWQKEFFEQRPAYWMQKKPWMKETPTVWMPKSDWRIRILPLLSKHCDVVAMKDIVEYLPPITPSLVQVPHEKYKKPEHELVTWVHEHQYEQTKKEIEVKRIAEGYRKVILVVHYTDQIDALATALGNERPVFILDGRTKKPEETIKQAQEADDAFLIVQASMGFGWDGYVFGTIIFVSMSHSVVNHTQMLGRIRHPKFLKDIDAYYLIGGRWDTRIYECIKNGQDFNPHTYEPT